MRLSYVEGNVCMLGNALVVAGCQRTCKCTNSVIVHGGCLL